MGGASEDGTAVRAAGVVLDLGDPDDLDYLWDVGGDAGALVCLWRDGVTPPGWFRDVALRLARDRAVTVLRYPVTDPVLVDCRGGRHHLPGPDLRAAVRDLADPSGDPPRTGYREVDLR